jgi:hypothetical protein
MCLTKTARTVSLFIVAVGLAINAPAQSFLTNGLVAYFPFNGDANDASGNGNHGVANAGVSATTDRFGTTNSAFLFDGVSGAIDISSLNTFQYRPITYSAWVVVKNYFPITVGHKFKAIVGRDKKFELNDGILGFFAEGLLGAVYQNTFLMWRGGGASGSDIPSSLAVPPTNVWLHIVYTHDANGRFGMYQNGVLMNTGNFTNLQNAVEPFRIGGCTGQGTYFWDDKLDDIRIYNRALSSNEVAELYAIESGPRVDLIKAVKPSFSYLWVGTNYQLQVSTDMNSWMNHGSPFTATNTSMVYPQYWDVENWGSLFFRLRTSP